ncbi:MAG: hypothetical protein Q8P04_01895 [bacterium]|nr:hypothetical protein [bacterium]
MRFPDGSVEGGQLQLDLPLEGEVSGEPSTEEVRIIKDLERRFHLTTEEAVEIYDEFFNPPRKGVPQ